MLIGNKYFVILYDDYRKITKNAYFNVYNDFEFEHTISHRYCTVPIAYYLIMTYF